MGSSTILVGLIGFLIGVIDFAKFSNKPDVMMYSAWLVSTGLGVLTYRKGKYVYHHDWLPGGSEVVFAEQWLSTHKRNEFAGMKTRFMERSAVDYVKTSWWPNVKTRFRKQISDALRQNSL